MSYKLKVLNIYLLSVSFLGPSLVFAADFGDIAANCAKTFQDVQIDEGDADAGVIANYRSKPGSVSYESEAFFRKALTQIGNIKPPPSFCEPGCKTDLVPLVYLQSQPNKILAEYNDKAYCQEQHAKTSKSPIKYHKDPIASVEELVSWVGELSQGKGIDGGDLYKQCDRSCSPQYEYKIIKNSVADKQLKATAYVVCGEARDKTDNLYKLKSFFRWQCEPTI